VTTLASPASAAIAICGGGLIGSSLALALAANGHHVRVTDRDADVRRQLLERFAGADLDGRATVHDDWRTAATDARVAIAAVPPSAIPEVLAVAAELAAPDALLTDVASVKAGVVAAVATALAPIRGSIGRYVGGHPMAGSEHSGPGAGDSGLFTGATWVLTPTAETGDATLARAGDLASGLGARVLVLRPEEHDDIVGLVSHLPQLVASVLADVAAEAVGTEREAVMAVAGPGFRDTTRIAASDPALWLDIVDGNRASILTALQLYARRLDELVDAIARSDLGALETVLRRASAARRQLLPKGIAEPTSDVRVPLRDRPGEIARIAGALGSAGINIEDLVMRHATAADRGALIVRIRTASVIRAMEALEHADIGGAIVEANGTGDVP